MITSLDKMRIAKTGCIVLVTLAVTLLYFAGSTLATGQACPAQIWASATPHVWASNGSVKVFLGNDATTNRPVIPTYADDGAYSPWGYSQHPQPITQLNSVWSCPSGTATIAVAGAGRETVSFQVFISAGVGTNSALSSVSLTVSPLTGSGGTLSSDNTQTSNVTRYLEGYVPYASPGSSHPASLQASGEVPDPLIPFYSPYDTGNPAVATPFNVQSGTTQGVWVNVKIPANQSAGEYTGTLTISGGVIGTATIPVVVTVWNGNLPTFDAGSIDSTYADMLKSWQPMYGGLNVAEGISCSDGIIGCDKVLPLYEKYQIMGHDYDMDVQIDGLGPTRTGGSPNWGVYPAYAGTSFTLDGTTSSLDWTAYDKYAGPALTPGGLFSDGTSMRVFDSPLTTAGAGAWVPVGWKALWIDYENGGTTLVPSGLQQLTNNFATQISNHFAYNHTNKGWGVPELFSYTFDETYNAYHSIDIGGTPAIYQDISLYNEAINTSNSALSSTWNPATFPIRTLLTDDPACWEKGDNPKYIDSACADHVNLSYPGDSLGTAGYTNSWVTVWSPNPLVSMPGRPGPELHYGYGSTLMSGTGYKYTFDLTDGVSALSTAPVPVERWMYQGGDPASGSEDLSGNGIGQRVNYWIAYKYGLDETIASVGDPTPSAPDPGGIWVWVANLWGGYGGNSTPSNCTNSSTPSPFATVPSSNALEDGVLFYPGNELGCYYTGNTVGAAVLTASPAVNTTCTSNGYNVCNGISGPVASIRLEQMRRGYEDYEYLYLLGKKSGRSAAQAIVDTLASDGMSSWGALNWQNVDAYQYITGVEPITDAYSGNCTDTTPGAGGLANGLPYGPVGAESSGLSGPCPGLWASDPEVYENARVQAAEALGYASITAPVISDLSPSSGTNTGGTTVVITGSNFSGATEVQFGGVEAASFTVNSATSITAVTPTGSGAAEVQVFTPNGDNAPSSGSVFTYISPVTVTGVSSNQGPVAGGNTVTISGTDFSSGATVLFGTTAGTNVVVSPATSLTVTAPAGTGEVNVTVTTADGTSAINSADLYTYEAAPAVSSIRPASGSVSGGSTVTITGSGFVSGATAQFGSTAATSVTVASDTSLTATTPASSSTNGGLVNVTVTTPYGTSGTSSTTRYNYLPPVTVTRLSAVTGPPAGGSSVVITGTDFSGATAVKFGANAASFTINSDTQITAITPAGGGTVDVVVTTPPYSSETSSADQYSYTAAVASGIFSTLPATAVGSTSASQNVSITLQSASAIGSISVPLAQNGAQEFTVGAASGCTVNGSTVNASGTVCTVPVTFTPQYPGIRTGTLTISNNGAVIGSAGLAGIGQGPEVVVSPGAITEYVGGGSNGVTATSQSLTTAALSVSTNGSALAMDGAGDLYIADNINCLAYKVNPLTSQIVVIAGNYNFLSGAVKPSTTPEPALGANTCPQAIAVDGAGNVYLVDANLTNGSGHSDRVEEVSAVTGEIAVIAGGGSATPSTTAQTATSVAINGANSLATDAAGNLYLSDFFNNLVEKVTPAGQLVVVAGGGSTAVSTTAQAATSAILNGPTGLVIDGSGNLFIADQNNGKIVEMTAAGQIAVVAGGGSFTPSTTAQTATSVEFNNPTGLAVDGAGNLYIADWSNNKVEQMNLAGQVVVVAGGGTTVPSGTSQAATSAKLGNIMGVEVDGAGNIYIADARNIGGGDNMVEKVSGAGQPLNFPTTAVGSTSVAQSLTLSNVGNQTLSLASVSAATDFPLQSGGTCTVTGTAAQTLASSSSCSIEFAYTPTVSGVAVEWGTLTDNNLNAASAQQLLAFTVNGASANTVGTPAFSPAAGGYLSAQTVTISDSTSNATIYYTTDGSTPTTSSTAYSGAITVSATETIHAIAVKANYPNSAVASAVYTINGTVATPVISPAAGAYGPAQTVTITTATSGATIYYTTDGSTPTTSSTIYTAPITVAVSKTITALAAESGYNNSAVASATYTINGAVATPVFSVAAGGYLASQTVSISDATAGATIYYTTDGSTPTSASTVYSGAITVSATETINTIAIEAGYSNSAVASALYTINGSAATPYFTPAAGAYGPAQTVTIGTTTPNATIYYTTNGSTPTTSSTVYSGAITVSATETIKALAVASGYNNSTVATASYTINGTVATPTFSVAAGSYGPAQTVSISTATSGATIYYTTNGSTPTTNSTVYSGAITVSATEVVEAIAIEAGYSNSAVASVSYTINGAVAAPTFSPAAGAYGPAQTVTISTATSGATIHYTTDGSTPTTSSTVYSGAITVSATETIKALAVETSFVNSAIASGTFTINGAVLTPTFSPAGGAYGPAQSVTISTVTPGATIYYTTNGTTPTTNSTLYSGAITVSASATIKAIAVETGYSNSVIGSTAYVINGAVATPTFSPLPGIYSTAQAVTISTATSGATIYYTTDGSAPTTNSTVYSGAITVSANETLSALAVKAGYSNSVIGLAGYTLSQNIALTPGTITTVAGNGVAGEPTPGSMAATSSIEPVYAVAVAPVLNGTGGDIYFSESTNYVKVIYEGGAAAKNIILANAAKNNNVTAPVVGAIYLVAGDGVANTSGVSTGAAGSSSGGSGILSSSSVVTAPRGLTVDSYGNLFIANYGDQTTNFQAQVVYAGNITAQGTNPAANLINLENTAISVSALTSASTYNGYLFNIIGGGQLTSSNAKAGYLDGGSYPFGIAVDSYENVYVTYSSSYLAYMVYSGSGTNALNILTTEGYTGIVAGYGYRIAGGHSGTTGYGEAALGYQGGAAGATGTAVSGIYEPAGVGVNPSTGDVFIAGLGDGKVSKLTASTALLTTVVGANAGTTNSGTSRGDGGVGHASTAATSAALSSPYGISVDAGGNVYIADSGNNAIRKLDANGYISTIVGTNTTTGVYSGDGGNATAAHLNGPRDVKLDMNGNLWIADTNNYAIREVVVNSAVAGTQGSSVTSSGSFAFGNVTVNTTSAAVSALVSNLTGASLTPSAINIPASFVQVAGGNTEAPDCSTSTAIPAGTSCTLALKFEPTATGLSSGNATVTVNSNDAVMIPVSGTGVLGTTATPTFNPVAGTYSTAQTVVISDTTSGAVIYYTANGTTPTTSSSVYSGTISVAATETVKAIAVASNYAPSAVASAAYTIQ